MLSKVRPAIQRPERPRTAAQAAGKAFGKIEGISLMARAETVSVADLDQIPNLDPSRSHAEDRRANRSGFDGGFEVEKEKSPAGGQRDSSGFASQDGSRSDLGERARSFSLEAAMEKEAAPEDPYRFVKVKNFLIRTTIDPPDIFAKKVTKIPPSRYAVGARLKVPVHSGDVAGSHGFVHEILSSTAKSSINSVRRRNRLAMISNLVDLSIVLLLAVLIGYPATLTALQAVNSRSRRAQQRGNR